MKLSLRHLLAVAFTVIATVPVLFLGAWVQKTSLEKELAAVHEKHLLLASNITAALERYAKDTEAAFNLFVTLADQGRPPTAFDELARQLGFRDFRILGSQDEIIRQIDVTNTEIAPIPAAVFAEIRATLSEDVAFSRVTDDGLGRPTIYLSRRLSSEHVALGSLDTAYIVQLQKAIAFGRKGHAAIVDHRGNLIAHPKAEWEREHKNIAKVEPVRRMLAGETGVTPFYSPAMKQDMISGFTTTPGPGWGVMVPQPMSELEERASDVRWAAFALGLIGIAVAAVISWFLAGLLAKPVQAVLDAARAISSGHLTARVETQSSLVPRELRDLSDGFNGMAKTIQNDQSTLLRAIEEIQLADRAKSEFLAAMSHELRTPLNAIIGFSEAIDHEICGPLGDERYKDYAQNINGAGTHLLTIINDILELSKLEAGKLELEDEEVDPLQVIRGALRLIAEPAREAELAVQFEPSGALPVVRGSEVKLKQVLVNLLSNAVKFTPAGGRITLSAWCDETGGLAVRVSDTGIGMARDEIEIALMPFRQIDGSLNRRYEGAGLGLPLAKRLTELHDGSLKIESTPGVGTNVTLRLGAPRLLAAAA